MKVLLIFVAITLLNGGRLVNTVWAFKVGKECIDTLKFKENGKVVQYDCELNYTFQGSFKFNKDTLLISIKDDSHPEDNGSATYYTDKYLMKNGILRFVGNCRLVNGRWENGKRQAGINVVYRKIR